MMGLFHVVDDAFVILRRKGVYRQAKIYRRNGRLYAGTGSTYIALIGEGRTTQPDTAWEPPVIGIKTVAAGFYIDLDGPHKPRSTMSVVT